MKRRLAVVAVLALIGGAAWLLTHRGSGTQLVSGTVEADVVRLASRSGGRVVALHAQEGDTLQPGQLLAELDAPELLARRDQAAAQLAELEHGPRAEEIAAAKAEWEALVAQLDFARHEARRAEDLFAAQTISITEREQAASRALALEKSVAAAEQRYALLVAGTRPEQIALARARLAELTAQVRELRVLAPETGGTAVLETWHVKVGDVVAPDRPVATVLLADRLWVRVFVPELWLGRIQLGQTVRVGARGTGVVEQIARQAEFTPRNVQTTADRIRQVFAVKVRLPADGGWRAGMSADVAFADVPPFPR